MAAEELVVSEKQVFCPNKECNAPIGKEITVGRQIWLQFENFEGYAVHGRCGKCKGEFHWTVGDIQLARLIFRYKQD